MEPLEVIDEYYGRTQIEDQFRVMKGPVETRSVFVRTSEHIEALPEEFYRFCNTDAPDLKLILDAFGIQIRPKLYTRGDLKLLKSKISVVE